MTSIAHQREDGALRIRASGDPSFAGQFNRAVEDRPRAGLHARYRHVDVSDVEIIKPERDRLHRRLGVHAADRLPSGGEQLVRACCAGVGLRLLPAKELAIKSKRLLPVGGEQLVPADAAWRVELGGLLLTAVEPFE